jgi:hypothetical protein
MADADVRALLELLERSIPGSDALPALAFLAGREIELDDELLRGPLRRALLLLAAGGDPSRELEVDGRAVTALAADISSPEARERLFQGLLGLRRESSGLDLVTAAVDVLLEDLDLAWRAYACTLLAAELDDSEDDNL